MTYARIEELDVDLWADYKREKKKVVPAFVYSNLVKNFFYGEHADKGLLLPWSKTHEHIKLRPGEVSIWAGVNGHGKSMLLNQVMLQAMANDERVCIASFEMRPEKTLGRMSRQAACAARPSPEFIEAFHDWMEGRLWIYDHQGTAKSRQVLAVLKYCSYGLLDRGNNAPIAHMVIDSLMKCGIGVDDYNRQKDFLDELCAHARDSGMHIHLVAHSRKTESERKIMDKFDVKGTGEITDQVDNVFSIWRNKRKEDESHKANNRDPEVMKEPDALLICSKQRNGEWEGKVGLYFHKPSLQYTASEGRPIDIAKIKIGAVATHQNYEPGTGDVHDFDESYVR